jgi:putative ABC transport system permease protein
MIDRIVKFFRIALLSLTENKTQALLTMRGIIIGIGAVIVILSIGRGAEGLILKSVESFGNRTIFVHPGGAEKGGAPQPTAIDKVKYKDYLAIRNFDYLQYVTPMLVSNGVMTYQSENQKAMIVGSNENYLLALKSGVSAGRNFDVNDINLSASVVILGPKIADQFFADQDPIGKIMKIDGKSFKVIGVSQKMGTKFFQDFDKRIVIPITTMRSQIYGVDYVMAVFADVKEGVDINQAIEDLRYVIRKRHAIYNPENDPGKDDFMIMSQVDAAKTFQGISDVLTYFLVMVAAISLLVGGIGIMNIMFVSVSERTREIGLRKAVGATNEDIMLQFLVESIVLTLVAGILGIISGLTISYMVSLLVQKYYEEWQFIVTANSVILAFTVSVIIGIGFGLYPAWKASKLDPIEALRSE